jgi:hypothetical protein
MSAFHDRARRKAGISVAMSASQDANTIGKTVRIAGISAVPTNEPIFPPRSLKISRARRFVRKQSLKFWKKLGERQFVSIKYVDNHACC